MFRIRNLLSLTFTALALAGCAAPGKRFERLNEALALSPTTEQGRAALEKQCQEGLSAACGFLGTSVEIEKPSSILQGVTTAKQTRFAVVNAAAVDVNYYLKSGNAISKLAFERVKSGGASVDHVEAFNLDPKTAYELLIVDSEARLVDRRAFRTLNTDRQRARILLLSGTDPLADSEGMKIWSEILAQKPDAIFLLGNHVSGADWNSHLKSRKRIPLYAANPLIPVLAIWNDRDYGKTNGDRTFEGKLASLETFQAFFPQKKPAAQFETGPGNAFWWNAFGAGFVFLDSRSFRSPDGLDLPDQTHLGVEQEAWVNARIAAGKQPVILISGDPFFASGSAGASFEGSHPKNFATLLKDWSAVKTPLIFFSGNRGLNEVVEVPKERLGFRTFEVTSAPLQGKPEAASYAVFELMRSERGIMRFHVQSFAPNAKLLFQKTLMVKH